MCTRADLLEAGRGVMDFVRGLLTEGGVSVIYGASNVGKSFWILDLGLHVATGKPWRHGEIQIDRGAVVYVALEGSSGLRNRLDAMSREGILPPETPFYVCFAAVSLLRADHAAMLAQSVLESASASALPCRLVIIDTLARAMAGGDENKGQDMSVAVSSIDAIRQATGAHVAIVHHTGKDEARGARGHSSLRAAVDTEIDIFRPEGNRISTVRVTKQRDLKCGEPMPFSLKPIVLGKDRWGEGITSCTVHHEDEMMATDRSKPGRPQCVPDSDLLALLPRKSTSAWQKAASEELGVSKSAFHRSLKKLRGVGAAQGEEGQWMRL